MLSSVLVTIAKSEEILQCMREILVMDPYFTPMSLFKYLTAGSTQLSRKNIISFLDENNLVDDDQETDDLIKKILSHYGINSSNGIAYTSFLRFIYPYNSGVLRELLSNRIKKYPEMDKMNKNHRPSDSVITAFLLLLEEEIKV
ncbi:MAG: hypothetical protein E6Q89_09190 [Bacteroidia bacterium]|nr:MAG: hypothetical protein E6Q89_09190 [Bacteroidia bacterium]